MHPIVILVVIICIVVITLQLNHVNDTRNSEYTGGRNSITSNTISTNYINRALIVDVANISSIICSNYNSNDDYIKTYMKSIQIHYNRKYTNNQLIVYVIKNKKNSRGAPLIMESHFRLMSAFVKRNYNSEIIVAEDYSIPTNIDNPEYHYLRGRDDFMLFAASKYFKKLGVETTIQSNDKFADYDEFIHVPEFNAVIFYQSRYRSNKYGLFPKSVPRTITDVYTKYISIYPTNIPLGSRYDYNIVKFKR